MTTPSRGMPDEPDLQIVDEDRARRPLTVRALAGQRPRGGATRKGDVEDGHELGPSRSGCHNPEPRGVRKKACPQAIKPLNVSPTSARRLREAELLQHLGRRALPLGHEDVAPMYCRSSTPILLDQKPEATRSRKLLKKAHALAHLGLAPWPSGPGDVVEHLRCARPRCSRGTSCRSGPAHSRSSQARPPRIAVWRLSRSRSVDEGIESSLSP